MMTPGTSLLHVSGAKLASDNETDTVIGTKDIQNIKKELLHYKKENKKLTDQLNCLVSLIRRSWTGDRIATGHLSNIVGISPPHHLATSSGTHARPNSSVDTAITKTRRCEQNWERFALKLLEREYMAVQTEIRKHQQHYIENRQLYMDAVLQDHHNNITKVQLHNTGVCNCSYYLNILLSDLLYNIYIFQKIGSRNLRRTQSAGPRRMRTTQEVVNGAEVSLRDLVGETKNLIIFFIDQMSEPYTITPSKYMPRHASSSQPRRLPPNVYNDPTRYTQTSLFEVSDNNIVKRTRPVSASSLKQGDIQRSRPRLNRDSSTELHTENKDLKKYFAVFITQNNERPLKYETTRPVTAKPKSGKQRRNSHAEEVKNIGDRSSTTASEVENPNVNTDSNLENERSKLSEFKGDDVESSTDRLDSKPPINVKVKSGFTRRPKFIDDFAKDEDAMKTIEKEFKKNALMLQKKLGINESGMVLFD
ncbi:unnamed protein product [Lymnaea stagnalis]|uniref:Uncharacterized protein n=1 Tax=Lymnaea stagnalis TaxID=6523 RepID=A0AAV2IM13_LYMST